VLVLYAINILGGWTGESGAHHYSCINVTIAIFSKYFFVLLVYFIDIDFLLISTFLVFQSFFFKFDLNTTTWRGVPPVSEWIRDPARQGGFIRSRESEHPSKQAPNCKTCLYNFLNISFYGFHTLSISYYSFFKFDLNTTVWWGAPSPWSGEPANCLAVRVPRTMARGRPSKQAPNYKLTCLLSRWHRLQKHQIAKPAIHSCRLTNHEGKDFLCVGKVERLFHQCAPGGFPKFPFLLHKEFQIVIVLWAY